MNVIVVGAGRLGTQFVDALAEAGNTVTVVDQDPAALERARARSGASGVTGDGCEPTILEEAGAHNADLLVSPTATPASMRGIRRHRRRSAAVPQFLS